MSRKNNRAKYARHIQYYKDDEKARIEKNIKKNEARKENKERARVGKKPKVKPVVAAGSAKDK